MKRTLSIGEKETVSQGGYSVFLREADGAVIFRLINKDGGVDESLSLKRGEGWTGDSYIASIEIENDHALAQDIDFYIGKRRFVSNRSASDVTVLGAVDLAGADVGGAEASLSVGVASVAVAAANAARAEMILKADPANTVPIFIATDAAATTGKGIPLEPGESLTLRYAGELAAISTVAAQTLWRTSLSNS